jgi:uncharacterized protein (TIGR02246 family)
MSRAMRGGLAVALLFGALAISACGRRSEESGAARVPSDMDSLAFHPESVQVRADVDSGNAQYLQAWRVGSADLLAGCFTHDGILTRQDGTALQGRDSITAYMGRVFTRLRMQRGTITTQAIRIDGDHAYETGTYRFEIVPIRGGAASIDSGQFAQVWKYESGQWKMLRNDERPRG